MFTEPCGLRTTKQGLTALSWDITCLFPYFLGKETIFEADSVTVPLQRAQQMDGLDLYPKDGAVRILTGGAAHPSFLHTGTCGRERDLKHLQKPSLFENLGLPWDH